MNRPGLTLFLLIAGAAVFHAPADAQDVEALGRAYGTRPPEAYLRAREADPRAFQFRRAWRRRAGVPLLTEAEGATQAFGAPLGERPNGVKGTLAFPLVLGLFSDSPEVPPYTSETVQAHFFDGPNPTGTIHQFYSEISNGLLNMVGVTSDWARTELSRNTVAGGTSGLLGPARVGDFIREILEAVDDGSVDWGQFDNDGPDGVPNSGDDDGFVDVLAVMHPTYGAECTGAKDLVWSHRWSISSWGGGTFETSSASASGGRILIDDYTIQPVRSCEGDLINEIGVFAHELGHGLGLPDLYNTGSGSHGAVGRWDLMASGSWGCQGGNPSRPCHMGAWSKAVLGWVEVETLAQGVDHGTLTLEPVETGARVYRIDAGDGTNEFFLLENRARLGYDQQLFGEGLLIWHIDQDLVDTRWWSNTINVTAGHMGVWIRAADGLNQAGLPGNDRGDAGDVFPGTTANTAFHAGSNPSSASHHGTPAGVTLLDIGRQGQDVTFRLMTGYRSVTVTAEGTDGAPALVEVDGAPPRATDLTFQSAPFQTHTLAAAAGQETSPGVRAGFMSWEDGSERIRSFTNQMGDSLLVATYGGDIEVRLDVRQESDAEGIEPGEIQFFPGSVDGWFDVGAEVLVSVAPRTGFSFSGWEGDLSGSENPVAVRMDGPMTATARYEVTFGVGEGAASVTLEAATEVELTLEAENANLPVTWAVRSGDLPPGLTLGSDGTLRGSAMAAGAFDLTVEARDGIGLEALAPIHLEVTAPGVGVAALTAPFFGQGTPPTDLQEEFLDRNGNRNGAYDLGDFRAFVLANPGLPEGVPAAVPAPRHLRVPLTFERAGGR